MCPSFSSIHTEQCFSWSRPTYPQGNPTHISSTLGKLCIIAHHSAPRIWTTKTGDGSVQLLLPRSVSPSHTSGHWVCGEEGVDRPVVPQAQRSPRTKILRKAGVNICFFCLYSDVSLITTPFTGITTRACALKEVAIRTLLTAYISTHVEGLFQDITRSLLAHLHHPSALRF